MRAPREPGSWSGAVWEARGQKLMRQTPGENVRRMEEAFARAISDLDFAVKQNPKLLPACDRPAVHRRQ